MMLRPRSPLFVSASSIAALTVSGGGISTDIVVAPDGATTYSDPVATGTDETVITVKSVAPGFGVSLTSRLVAKPSAPAPVVLVDRQEISTTQVGTVLNIELPATYDATLMGTLSGADKAGRLTVRRIGHDDVFVLDPTQTSYFNVLRSDFERSQAETLSITVDYLPTGATLTFSAATNFHPAD